MTLRALQAGAAIASVTFAAALVLELAGHAAAEPVAMLGVMAVIATPVAALAATAVERYSRERTTALLAVAVLVVLGVATAVALLART